MTTRDTARTATQPKAGVAQEACCVQETGNIQRVINSVMEQPKAINYSWR